MIDPVALSFLGIDIYWYGIVYVFTFLFGEYFIKKTVKKYGLSVKNCENLTIYIILGVIVGGRIGCFLFYEKTIFTSELLLIRNGGMSFHGGLIGGIIGAMIFAKRYEQNFLIIADLITLIAPIGLFLGRIANYINDEIFGKVIFGVYHPVVLYEAFFEGIILFLLLNVKYKKNFVKKGKTATLFLIYYSIFRFLLDIFKDDPIVILNMQMGQILCLPMLISGLILFFYNNKNF